MKLHSYVVNHDIGFAPNPFHGFCTLATCKPQIRRVASVGDWVMGTGAAKNRRSGFLVYAMRVTETLSFDEYWNDPRFGRKRPNLHGSNRVRFGDNVYHRDATGSWIQENSRHSRADGSLEPFHLARDTGITEQVLVSDDFVYFGSDGPPVPLHLREFNIIAGRGHRNHFDADQIKQTLQWFDELPRGPIGTPFDWHRASNLLLTRR
jgi:hypothetical protein